MYRYTEKIGLVIYCSLLKYPYTYQRFHLLFVCIIQDNEEPHIVMTNDDLLGDSIPSDQQNSLRQICYQFLKLQLPGV